jgi:prepilin-type N-terminal cleavage/methylation domain-containing protein
MRRLAGAAAFVFKTEAFAGGSMQGKKAGFTLIEMAIVLVIIGIILAGVMKGRDIVRGAQVKQFSQGFAQKWQTMANTYYDKLGQQFADGSANGGSGSGAGGGTPNGYMDGLWMDARGPAFKATALQAMRDVGITPCTLIKSDLEDDNGTTSCTNNYNVWARTVEGEFAGRSRVAMGAHSLVLGAGGPVRNCITFRNVPADVAKGLDTLVDGTADGVVGSCLCVRQQGATADAQTSTAPWHNTEQQAVTPVDWGTASNGELCTVALVLDY